MPARAEEKSDVDDMVGATFDTGIGKDRAGATSVGARYTRLHSFMSKEGPGAAWLGYGADARMVFHDFIDGGLFHLVGRAGFGMGTGIELEPVLGVGVGPDMFATGGLAALYGHPWFAVGLATQFPIAAKRPAWLETVQFVIRLQVPLAPCRSRFMSCAVDSSDQQK